jgi:DNA-binding GntR family transcriptional regulator
MKLDLNSVSFSVTRYLRNQIITGQLLPGQKLNEVALSSDLEISRPPLREAFRLLEAENLVFAIPRRGAFVTELTPEDFQELVEAREMIEICAINLIRDKKITDFTGIALSIIETQQLLLPETGASPEEKLSYLYRVVAFHTQIVAAGGNSRLKQYYEKLSSSLLRYQYRYFYMNGDRSVLIGEHQGILTALEEGAYEKAKELLRKHIRYRFDTFVRQD